MPKENYIQVHILQIQIQIICQRHWEINQILPLCLLFVPVNTHGWPSVLSHQPEDRLYNCYAVCRHNHNHITRERFFRKQKFSLFFCNIWENKGKKSFLLDARTCNYVRPKVTFNTFFSSF